MSVLESGMGHPVVIVEFKNKLGGRLVDSKDLVPEKPPSQGSQRV